MTRYHLWLDAMLDLPNESVFGDLGGSRQP